MPESRSVHSCKHLKLGCSCVREWSVHNIFGGVTTRIYKHHCVQPSHCRHSTQREERQASLLGCLACTKVAGNLTLQLPSCVPSLHLYPPTPYWSLTGTCHSLARTNTTKCCSSESCSECGGPGGVFKEIQVGVENFIVWQCEDCLPIQHPGVTGGVALETTSLFFLSAKQTYIS